MNYPIDDNLPILDHAVAIENLGGQELFIDLIGMFDETLIKILNELKSAIDRNDNPDIRMKAHTLKGSASYIQAERVRRVSEILQLCIDDKNTESVFLYYPLLVKESILLRRCIRMYLCEHNSNNCVNKLDAKFVEDEKDFEVPISRHFRIHKINAQTFDIVPNKKTAPPKSQSISDNGKVEKAREIREVAEVKGQTGGKSLQIVPEDVATKRVNEKQSKKNGDKNETVEKCACLVL